jgi:hypothetical protein
MRQKETPMKRTLLSAVVCLTLGGGGAAWAHGEKGKTMSMSDLPQTVQDTLKREAKSNKVEEIRKSTDESGNTVYKAEILEGTRGTDLTLSRDGKVLDRKSHEESTEGSHAPR